MRRSIVSFYEKLDIMCYDKSHGRLKYRGNGDYICLVCCNLRHNEKFDAKSNDEYIAVKDTLECGIRTAEMTTSHSFILN